MLPICSSHVCSTVAPLFIYITGGEADLHELFVVCVDGFEAPVCEYEIPFNLWTSQDAKVLMICIEAPRLWNIDAHVLHTEYILRPILLMSSRLYNLSISDNVEHATFISNLAHTIRRAYDLPG